MKMKRLKAIVMVVAMMMVLSGIVPVIASAASKKDGEVISAFNKKGKPILIVETNVYLPEENSVKSITVKDKVQLKVRYGDKNVTSKAVYKSSNEKVISVTKKGKLTAKKTGRATITIKYKGKTSKMYLVSKKPELDVTTDIELICPNDGSFPDRLQIEPEDTVQLIVKYDKKNVTAKAVYQSTDSNIITVTKEGKLIPKNPGICDVTIKYKGQTKTLKLVSHEHKWEIHYRTRSVLQGYTWYCDICKASASGVIDNPETSDIGWVHQRMHNDFSDTLKGHFEECYITEQYPAEYFCYGCCSSKPLDE